MLYKRIRPNLKLINYCFLTGLLFTQYILREISDLKICVLCMK
jgi:hypothetical protein